MLKLEMKISSRLVQQVGVIERFAGVWERLAQSEALASEAILHQSLERGAESCLRLDTSSPAGLSLYIEVQSGPNGRSDIIYGKDKNSAWSGRSNPLEAMIEAHLHPAEFDLDGIRQLQLLLALGQTASTPDELPQMRTSAQYFTAPDLGPRGNEVVFPTVSTFLVEQRLAELLEWTRHELEDGQFHPLFIIGAFHLLFLQIHPFSTANHRLALVLLWRLLDAHGYGFVRYSHFTPEIEQRSKQYFAALRQAEKTAYGNWSTLNIWLEYFLDTLLGASQSLLSLTERQVSSSRLTTVQRQIIDVIKSNGSATREKIVTETGINLSTVKYNLSVLANRGHLKRDGGGRSTSYRLL